MKTRLILLALSLLLLSGCASISSPRRPLHQLAGVYVGKVNSGGIEIPITTELAVDEKGHITGKYRMEESTGPANGELDEFHMEGPYTLRATWHDKYGTGTLRMLFSMDCLFFRGVWGENKNATLMRWDGRKER